MIMNTEALGRAARNGFISAQNENERKRLVEWNALGSYMKKAWIAAAVNVVNHIERKTDAAA